MIQVIETRLGLLFSLSPRRCATVPIETYVDAMQNGQFCPGELLHHVFAIANMTYIGKSLIRRNLPVDVLQTKSFLRGDVLRAARVYVAENGLPVRLDVRLNSFDNDDAINDDAVHIIGSLQIFNFDVNTTNEEVVDGINVESCFGAHRWLQIVFEREFTNESISTDFVHVINGPHHCTSFVNLERL